MLLWPGSVRITHRPSATLIRCKCTLLTGLPLLWSGTSVHYSQTSRYFGQVRVYITYRPSLLWSGTCAHYSQTFRYSDQMQVYITYRPSSFLVRYECTLLIGLLYFGQVQSATFMRFNPTDQVFTMYLEVHRNYTFGICTLAGIAHLSCANKAADEKQNKQAM